MRVLVVEDEEKMAGLLRRGLERNGLAVDVAPTGEEALWRAAATRFEVIILDRLLPGIDGTEVCRRLRADDVWSPILMLTAFGEVRDRVGGLYAGADDYLTKPFDFEELLARIRALARRGPVSLTAVLEVGDLRLDPATHQRGTRCWSTAGTTATRTARRSSRSTSGNFARRSTVPSAR